LESGGRNQFSTGNKGYCKKGCFVVTCPFCAGVVAVLPAKAVKARFWYFKKKKRYNPVFQYLEVIQVKSWLMPRFCLSCNNVFWQNRQAKILVLQTAWNSWQVLKGIEKVEGWVDAEKFVQEARWQ